MTHSTEQGGVADVIAWALDIAAAAPDKPGQYVSYAKIPWPMIEGLRTALDEAGTDWRAVKRAWAAGDAR